MSINAWGSDDPAEVAKGGTGNATLNDGGVLLGSGTAAVTVTAAPTNGQLLIGNTGSDPSVAAPTGDSNEIAITTGAGTIAVGIADDAILPGTGAFTWVDGTTGERPGTPVNGMARYNTTTAMFEGYQGGAWVPFISGGTSGVVLQSVYAEDATSAGLTAVIPPDDTIPQNTEGTEIVTVSITPLFSTSTLYVEAGTWGQLNASQVGTIALFRDATAGAIGATMGGIGASLYNVIARASVAATSTSTTIFKMRAGPSAGPWRILGTGVSRLLGGTAKSYIRVIELSA